MIEGDIVNNSNKKHKNDGNDDYSHRKIYLKLHQEYRILHLLYHRNKNQHHVAIWWKRFNILKRSCGQVIEILQDKKIKGSKNWFKLYNLIENLINKQINKIYYDFNGIIALGQFVTLGVVLIGLLSRIYNCYIDILELFKDNFIKYGCKAIITNSRNDNFNDMKYKETEKLLESITNEELGENLKDMSDNGNKLMEITKDYPILSIDDINLLNINKTSNSNTKDGRMSNKSKKKKKSKPKSAIDDIFS
ncbi:hypothetical protein Kpol_397p13 [Vanderwaltozyma polyspora DSM 70294]|uniref:RNase MRP protein 1 RNA binding domain-containing protein n=1 Tax=Vanderwaltozyma polyspora (strain ATCC 22028 / DSM 70294 / BCRC 21397 / CBS 2163 / NBRC 10782 / NRRL Y-8283 / UCD 57-17) TaxID=436907 RepID=A7TRG4_VANPO|nr:uncharacterized protein Kpol_397p13 [Vanderwaltozyma polyspora DSM 70294]EDO15153.1 hypothetical protein Kpol_397p13 [Vanderwaltozyma polyspora DSM 70294]